MAPRTQQLQTWLQSLVPFWGGGDAGDVPLRTVRLALALVAVLNLVFWAVFRISEPVGVDPLWARALLTALALATLAASYAVPAVRDRPQRVLVVVAEVILVWFAVLVGLNRFAADYVIGYCFVLMAVGLLSSLVWNRPGPLALVLTTGSVFGVASSLTVGPEGASPAVFVVVIVAGSVLFFVGFYGRLRVAEALVDSEARLIEAERLAQTGAWTHDLATGGRTWSQGIYAILGTEPPAGPPPLIYDYIHPDDLEECRASMAQLAAEPRELRLRFRVVRPDGEVRWVEGTAAQDASGRRLRGVIQDVTERMAYEAALEEARDRAETANRAKSGFLANMSHEIRTPLTAIIGYAQVLQEEVTGEHAALVAPIEVGGRRLLGTLNSVLDLARMESGQSELEVRDVDLAAEAADVVSLLQSQAERKGLALLLAPTPAPVTARADPDALGRVLANLVSNAVKFTDAGRVSVAVREADGRAELAVADTGRGMDTAFLEHLYSPFHQASSGWARSHEGTGLGLTITQRLVRAMGGEIRVTSEPGVGSTFVVSLPLADGVAPPADAPEPARRDMPASAPAPAGA